VLPTVGCCECGCGLLCGQRAHCGIGAHHTGSASDQWQRNGDAGNGDAHSSVLTPCSLKSLPIQLCRAHSVSDSLHVCLLQRVPAHLCRANRLFKTCLHAPTSSSCRTQTKPSTPGAAPTPSSLTSPLWRSTQTAPPASSTPTTGAWGLAVGAFLPVALSVFEK